MTASPRPRYTEPAAADEADATGAATDDADQAEPAKA